MNPADRNRAAYTDPRVVQHYAKQTSLFAAEVELLADCPPLEELDVLDLGIGGGRTTQSLAPRARRYVGIDYIPAMVHSANVATGDQWDLRLGDAADLSDLSDAQFDLVVFSFNGLGTLPDTDSRLRCLSEIRRVTRPGGLFLFSVGNVAYLKTPLENVENLRDRIRSNLGYLHHVRRVLEPVFWTRHGWRTDTVLDGKKLHSYGAHPKFVRSELAHAGFKVERTVNGLFPRDLRPSSTPWWYYLATRI